MITLWFMNTGVIMTGFQANPSHEHVQLYCKTLCARKTKYSLVFHICFPLWIGFINFVRLSLMFNFYKLDEDLIRPKWDCIQCYYEHNVMERWTGECFWTSFTVYKHTFYARWQFNQNTYHRLFVLGHHLAPPTGRKASSLEQWYFSQGKEYKSQWQPWLSWRENK